MQKKTRHTCHRNLMTPQLEPRPAQKLFESCWEIFFTSPLKGARLCRVFGLKISKGLSKPPLHDSLANWQHLPRTVALCEEDLCGRSALPSIASGASRGMLEIKKYKAGAAVWQALHIDARTNMQIKDKKTKQCALERWQARKLPKHTLTREVNLKGFLVGSCLTEAFLSEKTHQSFCQWATIFPKVLFAIWIKSKRLWRLKSD